MENKLFVRVMIFMALGLVTWLFFPFLKSFFVALLLAIVVFPLHRIVEAKIRNLRWFQPFSCVVSAGIVTLGLSLILFTPIALFLYHLLTQPASTVTTLKSLGSQIDTLSSQLPPFLSWLKEPFDQLIEMGKLHKDDIITAIAGWLGSGLKTFASMLGEMAMIVIFFFFLSWYGRSIILFLLPIIPLSRSIKRDFFTDILTTTAVVFYTLGGVMIAQGLAFGIFIAFFEGYNPFLLGFMTAISAVIPVVGTALVWVPVALNEYFRGNVVNAVIIIIYSWAMMAFFIDNILKLVILNFVNRTLSDGKNRMNEFLIFFSIVGGLATFGFWGFIFGPAIVAFALTTLRMLRKANRSVLH
ncbi:AI-2E family transporter [Sulfuricurvum sp.]|uniref:AI-2E family transporter n=1 Tax=Sulfuricurvum sp. TaxID=2025608 RepID=UPI002602F86D|nr:AI-2E family transporter [Sulfuricurvum sp.]MDD2782384.1 AI-2E family transporter [Sulfuricurvum sp.]